MLRRRRVLQAAREPPGEDARTGREGEEEAGPLPREVRHLVEDVPGLPVLQPRRHAVGALGDLPDEVGRQAPVGGVGHAAQLVPERPQARRGLALLLGGLRGQARPCLAEEVAGLARGRRGDVRRLVAGLLQQALSTVGGGVRQPCSLVLGGARHVRGGTAGVVRAHRALLHSLLRVSLSSPVTFSTTPGLGVVGAGRGAAE
ncbi:hypothetical protein [Cellulomonas flavigena]|uniref:hypothetical protein n=1 Tax=Cellulomonas flavigena TaxID=1711 RepID=UPI00019E42C6|nr:hypothetical protein [Cellulomonas flavigena]